MAQQAIPPDSNSTVDLLLKALLTILQKLSDPIPSFVLAIWYLFTGVSPYCNRSQLPLSIANNCY